MTILLTGGTGKTSLQLAPLLTQASKPFLLTSRRGPASFPADLQAHAVTFDFTDESTYENPFKAAKEPITAVYLVAPEVADPSPPEIAFINFAVERGVKRFVQLGGGTAVPGGPFFGGAWQRMLDLGFQSTVLKATWFNGKSSHVAYLHKPFIQTGRGITFNEVEYMVQYSRVDDHLENFIQEYWGFNESIRKEGKIYSAVGDGKSYYQSTKDIARVAFKALTSSIPPPGEFEILGPEPLSYDDIASIFTKVLGRKIEHVRLTPDERKKQHLARGLPEHYADLLVWLETYTAEGNEERPGKWKDDIERYTGQKPQRFEDWLKENRTAFE
ncbi:MAG: hypothetical protein Q9162_001982 [Coniocarpon cinnabarinum]